MSKVIETVQVVELDENGNHWEFEQIVKIANGMMFRISIRRTNWKFSTNHAEIAKWSDEQGWNTFHILGHDAKYMEFDPSARRRVRGVDVDIDFTPFYESADELFSIAERFFGF